MKCANPTTLKKWFKEETRDEVLLAVTKRMRKLKLDPDDIQKEIDGEEAKEPLNEDDDLTDDTPSEEEGDEGGGDDDDLGDGDGSDGEGGDDDGEDLSDDEDEIPDLDQGN